MLSVVGSNSQCAKQAEMLNQMLTTKASGKVSFIRVQNVGNVMLEAPNKLSEAIILFCQGLGMMPAVLGTRRRIISRISMSEADVPNIGRLSLSE